MAGVVLDASAMLAYLREEPGAESVVDAMSGGEAVISSVNLGEVLSWAAERGADPAAMAERLGASGVLGRAITAVPFTIEDAIETARLRPLTRHAGLSFADRACLALAARLASPALTADRAWRDLALSIDVRQIR